MKNWNWSTLFESGAVRGEWRDLGMEGLDVYENFHSQIEAEADCGLECGDGLLLPQAGGKVGGGVKVRGALPGKEGDESGAVRRPVHAVVVEDDGDPIAGELEVKLHCVRSQILCLILQLLKI